MGSREDYAHEGPVRFGDADLIALILGTAAGGRAALEIAAGLLARHGGLAGIAAAPVAALAREVGMGPAREESPGLALLVPGLGGVEKVTSWRRPERG